MQMTHRSLCGPQTLKAEKSDIEAIRPVVVIVVLQISTPSSSRNPTHMLMIAIYTDTVRLRVTSGFCA